jgi:hypothetical protein
MRQRMKFFQWTRCLFARHPSITIRYEEVEADIHSILNYCQGFLGVRLERLPVTYSKLTNRTPRELIANFDEVATGLRETEFTRFLDRVEATESSWAETPLTPGEVAWPSI